MARRYDTRSTTFSPEGRLYQVEYALEAISMAGTCIGVLCRQGIVLMTEKRHSSKLLEDTQVSEKLYKLHDSMFCSVAGLTSDANILVDEARLISQRYQLTYLDTVPCEYLVAHLCDIKQAYTQFGGRRPFGVSFLYAGYDIHRGLQLFQSDPSGNYSGWKATCIGNNSQSAIALLKQEYKSEDMSLDEAKMLAVKVMYKSVDASKLTCERCEMSILTLGDNKTPIMLSIGKDELKKYIDIYEAEVEAKEQADRDKKQTERL
ncbi:hypothetical protein GJ496_003541 [Pomphorhynchus laevis]|nr:hypothetical protein GJ496_003541 [Pomphorhynchus laevis]